MYFFEEIRKRVAFENTFSKKLFFVLACSLLFRLFLASIARISGDTCWHTNVVKYIATTGIIPVFEHLGRDFFWAPPLFHLISVVSYRLFGEILGNFSILFLSPFFATIMLLFSFLIIKDIFNEKIAFYATVFFSFLPINLSVSATPYVDTLLGAFVLASIYAALKQRIVVSAVLLGLGFLTKYNALFAVPTIFYIIYIKYDRKWNIILKNICIFLIVVFLISSVWLIRNWDVFGNPVWPFFNDVFHGYPTINEFQLKLQYDSNDILRFYLETFGVPEGKFSSVQLINNDFFIGLWIVAILLFTLPAFLGIKKIRLTRSWNIVAIFLLSFLVEQVLVSSLARFVSPRWMLVSFFSVSVLWAHGLESILSEFKQYRIAVCSILTLIVIGFLLTLVVRNVYASALWEPYEKDFNWAATHIEQNALVFVPHGQCFSFNIGHFTVTTTYGLENRVLISEEYIQKNVQYIFSTQKSAVVSSFNETTLQLISRYPVIYENNQTGTKIYKVQ